MGFPFPTRIECGVDWYSASMPLTPENQAAYDLFWARLGRTMQKQALDIGERAIPQTMYGAAGWRISGMFYGSRNHSRILVITTGAMADRTFRDVWRGDCGVNRIDLQMTASFAPGTDVDGLIAFLRGSGSFKSTWIESDTRTLYVGSLKSDTRLVVYNKSTDTEPRMRIEVRYRDDKARYVGNYVAGGISADYRANVAEVVHNAYANMIDGPIPEFLLVRGERLKVPSRRPSEDEIARTRQWLEAQVKPALTRLSLRTGQTPGELIARHLLDNTSE